MLSVVVHKLTALGNTWEHRLPGLTKDPSKIELSSHLPDGNSIGRDVFWFSKCNITI